MQFINLHAQYERIQDKIEGRMRQVLGHCHFVMGPEIGELEERLAALAGVKHCITVSNGTLAILVALMALDIQPGDEVITSTFSFIAAAEMVALCGAKPVFVDIDPRTYNLDPQGLAAAITTKTKAIIPIDLFGQCADYDAIKAVTARHGIPVIEDAAQSFGATYKGRSAGGLGTIATTSFFPSKPLGCYGEGGACFTDDDILARKMRRIRHHGEEGRYHHVALGLNGRLETLQAAILLAKLEVFEDEVTRRHRVAGQYGRLLRAHVAVPHIEAHNTSVYAQYTIQVSGRDAMRARLSERGIPTAVHYPSTLHRQPIFSSSSSSAASYPHAEAAAEHVLSLPFHPYLSEAEIAEVAAAVVDACAIKAAQHG